MKKDLFIIGFVMMLWASPGFGPAGDRTGRNGAPTATSKSATAGFHWTAAPARRI